MLENDGSVVVGKQTLKFPIDAIFVEIEAV